MAAVLNMPIKYIGHLRGKGIQQNIGKSSKGIITDTGVSKCDDFC